MAELFLAQDEPEAPLVVIKRILPYLSSEADFVRMFLDEARIAAQLHHENIVRVHELGKIEESIFIAMEYVAGIDLRKLLQQEQKQNGALPYHLAAYLVAEVCAGLYHAHNCKGVDGRVLELIHRDISPQNVMVGYDGHVKLVDFGIARANSFMERSQPGVLKGKFLYLSPEQVLQQELDHRADLFAIGTLLYEITTGKTPFQRSSAEAVLYAIRHEQPPAPQLVRSDYPPPLAQIVARCLTKDREKRYQQADEIRRDLLAFVAANPVTPAIVSDYVAALFGDEDERTILNIPLVGNNSQATLIAPPVLAPPPARRPGEIRAKFSAPSNTADTDPGPQPTPRRTRPSLPPPPPLPPGRRPTRSVPPQEAPPAAPDDPAAITASTSGEVGTRRRDTGEEPSRSDVTVPPTPVISRPPVPRKPTRIEQVAGAPPPSGADDRTGSLSGDFTQSTTHRAPKPSRLWLLIGGLCIFLLAGVGVLSYRVRHAAPMMLPSPGAPSRTAPAEVAPAPTPPAPDKAPEAAPADPLPSPDAPKADLPPPSAPIHSSARVLFHFARGVVVSVNGTSTISNKPVDVAPGTLRYSVHCPGHHPELLTAQVEPNPAKLQTIMVKCHR